MDILKKIFIFIFAFIFLDYIVSNALFEISNVSKIRYSRIYGERINADVVFVGNSRAINCFYVPFFDELSGNKSINFSYNGLSLPVAKIFLDDYLGRNKPPRLIFVEITCVNDNYSVLPDFKQYMMNSPSIRNAIKKYYPKIYYTSKIFKSYIFNSEYFLRTLYYLNNDDQSWINRYTIDMEYYKKIVPGRSFDLLTKINDNSMLLFNSMVNEYCKKGITIVPVIAPVIDKYRNEKYINKFICDFENRSKLMVVDFSSIIKDVEMFADPIHTNDKGAYYIAQKLCSIKRLSNKIHVNIF